MRILFAFTGARADYVAEVPQAPPPPTDEFWREVVAPHGDEIQQIVDKARQGLAFLPTCLQQDCDPTGEQRTKLLDDMYGMLRYARKLDPTQTDVLMLLGQVAEESGRASATRSATSAMRLTIGSSMPGRRRSGQHARGLARDRAPHDAGPAVFITDSGPRAVPAGCARVTLASRLL